MNRILVRVVSEAKLWILLTMIALQQPMMVQAGVQPVFANEFATAAPVTGDMTAASLKAAGRSGSFSHTVPIVVPPGRNGMQPTLGLHYSTENPNYGELARGWRLAGFPEIRLDTRTGASDTNSGYVSDLAGGARLYAVNVPKANDVEQVYRAELDNSFALYERMKSSAAYEWRVRFPNGRVLTFGQRGVTESQPTPAARPVDLVAPLYTETDAYGNRIRYAYRWIGDRSIGYTIRPYGVYYTENDAINNGAHHASILFTYETTLSPCGKNDVQPGSSLDFRMGVPFKKGWSTLKKVTTYAWGDHRAESKVREYHLGYTVADPCDAATGRDRVLNHVSVTAYDPAGNPSSQPPIEFRYGQRSDHTWVASNLGNFNPETQYVLPKMEGRTQSRELTKLMDIDSDGLLDYVTAAEVNGQARLYWKKNLGNTFSNTTRSINLPTLPWRSGNASSGSEYVSITHQMTTYTTEANGNYTGSYLTYRFMDFNNDGIKDLVAGISHAEEALPNPDLMPTPFDYSYDRSTNFPTSFTDEVERYLDETWFGTPLPPNVPTDPSRIRPHRRDGGYPWIVYSGTGGGNFESEPLVWKMPVPVHVGATRSHQYVHQKQPTKDLRNLVWDNTCPDCVAPPYISSATGQFVSNWSADPFMLTDMDGDGILDVVSNYLNQDELNNVTTPRPWRVLKGMPNGGVSPYMDLVSGPAAVNYTQPTSMISATVAFSESSGNRETQLFLGYRALVDLNGDGLQDLWRPYRQSTTAYPPNPTYDELDYHLISAGYNYHTRVDYSMGWAYHYEPNSRFYETEVSEPGLASTMKPLGVMGAIKYNVFFGDLHLDNAMLKNGVGLQAHRFLDYDGDGLQDWVVVESDWEGASAYPGLTTGIKAFVRINTGDYFLPEVEIDNPHVAAALGNLYDRSALGPSSGFEAQHDAVAMSLDFDGDGFIDAIRQKTDGSWELLRRDFDGVPPGYLSKIIENGATTTVTYAPMSDATVVTNRKAPVTGWVVKNVSVNPGGPGQIMQFSYTYDDPVFAKNEVSRYGFRGFREVSRVAPTGSTEVTTYDYSHDHRGQVVAQEIYTSSGALHQTITKEYEIHDWDPQGSRWSLPSRTETRWCGDGQTASDCENSRDYKIDEVSYDLIRFDSNEPYMYAKTRETTFFSRDGAYPGGLLHETEYATRLNADYLMIAPERIERYDTDGQNERAVGITEFVFYNGGQGPDLHNIRYVYEYTDKDNKITRFYDRDPVTGNIRATMSAEAWERYLDTGVSQSQRFYFEDDDKVHATKMVNELGHTVKLTVDPGTGKTLLWEGPNWRCSNGSDCGIGSSQANLFTAKVEIDGFGREIKKWTSRPQPGNPNQYQLWLVETNQYNDWPTDYSGYDSNAGVIYNVRSVTNRKLMIDGASEAEDEWMVRHTYLDGLGRTARTLDVIPDKPDAVHQSYFDNRGLVSSTISPSPQTDGTYEAYAYAYDSLGRVIRIHAPDPDNTSGNYVHMSFEYDGLRTTTKKNPHETNYAAKTEIKDGLGNLIGVEERLDPDNDPATPDEWAVTTYDVTVNGEVWRITDPEGVQTRMIPDWLGRRTDIYRGNQHWEYIYDANGNLTGEVMPHPASAEDADYTIVREFDLLGRLTKEIVPAAGLSAATRNDLAVGETVYVYDQPHADLQQAAPYSGSGDMIGRLAYSMGPVVTNIFGYGPSGDETYYRQNLNIAGLGQASSDQFELHETLTINGLLQAQQYRDVVAASDLDERLQYDYQAGRQLLREISTSTRQFALYNHNTAGLITSRSSTHAGLTATWSYDRQARPVSLDVLTSAGLTFYYNDLEFNHHGQVDYMEETFGTGSAVSRAYSYEYDTRDQLISAVQMTGDINLYNGAFAYDRAGRLASAQVGLETGVEPGMRIRPRNVSYQYESANPQQLDRLVNFHGSGDFADYAYDERGNNTQREIEGSTWNYIYDGSNRLREAVHPDGSREQYFYDNNKRVLSLRMTNTGQVDKIKRWFAGMEFHYDNGVRDKYWLNIKGGQSLGRSFDGGTQTEYVYLNQQNSRVLAVDNNNQVRPVQRHYGPFGELLADTVDPANADLYSEGFNDKQYDNVSDLSYYGYRFYDAVALMWNRQDPIYRELPERRYNDPRNSNLYAFSLNNPINLYDPDGRETETSGPKAESKPTIKVGKSAGKPSKTKVEVVKGNGYQIGGDNANLQVGAYDVNVTRTGLEAGVSTIQGEVNGEYGDDDAAIRGGLEGKGPSATLELGYRDGRVGAQAEFVAASAKGSGGFSILGFRIGGSAEIKAGVAIGGSAAPGDGEFNGALGPVELGVDLGCSGSVCGAIVDFFTDDDDEDWVIVKPYREPYIIGIQCSKEKGGDLEFVYADAGEEE